MANLKNNGDHARAKTISLPDWMWEIIDGSGNRSLFIRKQLEKHSDIRKVKKEKEDEYKLGK